MTDTHFKDIGIDELLAPLEESKLVPLIQKISHNFTKDRSKIGDYIETDQFVSAYTWFYMPTNKFKLGYFFDLLDDSLINLISNSPFIDYGCGPGTYTWALLDYFENKTPFSNNLFLVDKSRPMLRQARKIHAESYSDYPIANFLSDIPQGSVKDPVLFFGNSLNEMSLNHIESLIQKLDPIAIAYIEPGTKESFNQLLNLRNYLIENGYTINYPCPSQEICPLNNSNDWCHQIVLPDYPESIHRKCQLTSLDRRSLPMVAHFFTKTPVSQSQNSGLIFRYLGETKGTINFEVCLKTETGNELKRIEAEKRGLSKKQIKQIKQMTSGMPIKFQITKTLENETIRCKIELSE